MSRNGGVSTGKRIGGLIAGAGQFGFLHVLIEVLFLKYIV